MKIREMQRGQIWWFLTPQMRPCPKVKCNLCIGSSQFLTINTSDRYGKFKLDKTEYPFLSHDSYIGDIIFDFSGEDEEIEVDNKQFRQIISDKTAIQLIDYVKKSRVLTPVNKDIVIAALTPPFPPPP
ncbi:hypothetical protein COY52_04755 [Candidatus Desantisbacteria bacterium CG_4_10_14_0_8_um_filter_48_22]|uniref:Uncharacterized protein n=1 Tax=Candidatus Desantisbacteria bacterium CG_4_10_14_0_8_um_filter_48_22 TaxID=1974543 RepID=A0A2M7SCT8_9BACT|nr:MAG: hypothetical protein AUJ67_02535 [Candidatus Desantisbacteria bacterium CG1_02_49_89]PIZ17301.1 MAG: hypothetical protein COY52_04755 [Candidatus Desantisbacteria bacterium CG_4_10_14_0_8_um_filter_48_22]